MSIEKLSPSMRSCILELQSESMVSINYSKVKNKNNTGSFLSRILKSFK
jgi:hypothetical protein